MKAKQYITIPLSMGGVGVEQCQQIPRFSALVELGRFPSNDLEPPSRCSDNMNARAIPTFHAVGECSDTLQNVGFTPPSWKDLAKGEPPPEEDVKSEDDRNIPRGWQKASTKMVEQAYFSAKIQPQLTESKAAFSPPIGRPESILGLSGCCSAEDFTSLYPFLPVIADVAVHLTPMAIIVQRAGKLGCWEDEDFQWRKPQDRCAGKVAAECQPTLWSETWTSHQLELAIPGGWKLLTGSVCSTGPNWPLTQHNNCVSFETGRLRQARSGTEERCCATLCAEGQGTHTQS